MVECIIGFKCGMGGLSGVLFLCKVLDFMFFFELYVVCIEI